MGSKLIPIQTFFVGDYEEVVDFTKEWKRMFDIEVSVEKNTNDKLVFGDSWYCNAFVTKKKFDDLHLDYEWIKL